MTLDDHSAEQDSMLQEYHFGGSGHGEPAGSISPFVPCASRRIPAVLRAARLQPTDCFWDLGCGDGRMCHQAAAQYGCDCVGVEIIEACVEEARARAAEQHLDALCRFGVCDLTALPPGSLRPDGNASHVELEAPRGGGEPLRARAPTVCVLFITSHGLSRLKGWLRQEWARGGLRIITCVERLDSCFDFEAEDPLFGQEDADSETPWPLYTAHERDGVFVVPPLGTSVDAWAAAEEAWIPRPPLTPAEADASAHIVLRGLLDDKEIDRLCALGESVLRDQAHDAPCSLDLFESSEAHTSAEDYFHNSEDNAEHRVAHLHRDGAMQRVEGRLLDRILAAVRRADATRFGLLVGRPSSLRSAEYHTYSSGGSVGDPEHRDHGSLLTLTVLLSAADECVAGGGLLMANAAAHDAPMTPVALTRGDGCLFASEKRHNVTPVVGHRRSFVLELWAGPPTQFNRHS